MSAALYDDEVNNFHLCVSSSALRVLDVVRKWRNACVDSAETQNALVSAGASRALVVFLRACEAEIVAANGNSALMDELALARRVGWQALGNICAGNEDTSADVFGAITAYPTDGGGANDLAAGGSVAASRHAAVFEIGAVASANDEKLGGVVAGVVYTCAHGDRSRLSTFSSLERFLLPYLRLAQPTHRDSGAGGASTTISFAASEWVGFFVEALLKHGLFPAALAAARRGVSATALLSDGGSTLQYGRGITTEVAILLAALQVANEAALYGCGGVGTSASRDPAAATTIGAHLRLCAPALRSLLLEAIAGACEAPKSQQCALAHLHISLCLRTASSAAALLADDAACGGGTHGEGDGGGSNVSEEEIEAIGKALARVLAIAADDSSCVSMPPFLRPAIARALALLFADGTALSDAFERGAISADVVPGLLVHTTVTERAPTLREWALLAIRRIAASRGAHGDAARVALGEAVSSARDAKARLDEFGKNQAEDQTV